MSRLCCVIIAPQCLIAFAAPLGFGFGPQMLAVVLAPSMAADMVQQLHCADANGAIIGLTSDTTYNIRLPADGPPLGTNPEKWTRVDRNRPPTGQPALNGSFTGTYMQVLPDDRDSYNAIMGEGSFTMTGLEYAFAVKTAGKHTLHLRWTAGDDYGGGDSLYAVVREYDDSDALVSGVDTLKPKLVGINDVPGQFAGCCYNDKTHECPCYATVQADCPENYWQAPARAANWAKCNAGEGVMTAVPAPRWYLFSGQLDPTAMSFDAGMPRKAPTPG